MVFSVAITMLITYLAFGQFSWIPWLIGMGTGWINAYIYNMLQKKYGGLFQIKGF
jgi:xanthine/uracil permease